MKPARWTPACTATLVRVSKSGATDAEIAAHIAQRTGLRFRPRTVMVRRQLLGLDNCYRIPWMRRAMRLRMMA